MAFKPPGRPRLASARRRARLARLVLGSGAVALFGASAGLARLHEPGHHKNEVTQLAPPASLVEVVRRNRLEAGILAPAQATPQIASAPS